MKRTPWFSARHEPPVNGGSDAEYEWKCGDDPPARQSKAFIRNVLWRCPHCQWRGLTKKEQK